MISYRNKTFTLCNCWPYVYRLYLKVTQQAVWWSNESKYSKLKCGKVLSKENGYKSVKTAFLLSNVIDADHQNSCLFTNKGHFSPSLWVLVGVLAKCHEYYALPIALIIDSWNTFQPLI